MTQIGLNPLGGYKFAQDFINGTGAARQFLPDESAERLGGIDQRWSPWGSEDVAELSAFNLACGNEPGVQLASALAKPGTLAVVTGQQPNLFASPLYIIYKALFCYEQARKLSSETGRTVIPIFWIASDDHDFEELAQCSIVGPRGDFTNLADIVHRGDGVPVGSPAFEWTLADSKERILQRLDSLFDSTSEYPKSRQLVEESLAANATFESLFARMLSNYLHETPMVFLTPRLNCMRKSQSALFSSDIDLNGNARVAIEARTDAMAEAGYAPQLHRNRDVLNFFMFVDSIRARLVRRGSEITAEHPSSHAPLRTFTVDELRLQLQSSPHLFSPNVVTRPMLQDSALPVAAYVAGPGEVAYLAQLGEAYKVYGVTQSSVHLRKSLTIIDSSLKRLAGENKSALLSPGQLTEALAESTSLQQAYAKLAELQNSIDARLNEIEEDGPHHPHVRVAFSKTSKSISAATNHLRRRLARHEAAFNPSYSASIQRAVHMLFPAGAPQERVLSPLSFAAQMTPRELGKTLYSAANWSTNMHEVIIL